MSTVTVPKTALRLCGQQQLMYLSLYEQGTQSTDGLRKLGVANPALAALALNRKFANWNMQSRVACEMKPHVTAIGERGYIGWWTLTEAENLDTLGE